jgi:transcriptional repressor NrdR
VRCPFCGHLEDKVVDSRSGKDGDVIRRRRECLACQRRYTSYERVEEILPWVVKKDGRREPFDRTKLLAGIKKACEKRPISMDDIEEIVVAIEKELQERTQREISSVEIGELVMERLHRIDGVAYVRFASVYRQFQDVNEFVKELSGLLRQKAGK